MTESVCKLKRSVVHITINTKVITYSSSVFIVIHYIYNSCILTLIDWTQQ